MNRFRRMVTSIRDMLPKNPFSKTGAVAEPEGISKPGTTDAVHSPAVVRASALTEVSPREIEDAARTRAGHREVLKKLLGIKPPQEADQDTVKKSIERTGTAKIVEMIGTINERPADEQIAIRAIVRLSGNAKLSHKLHEQTLLLPSGSGKN